MQSLLSGYKRINIPLNPESSQGRAKAAAQYSQLHLSLLFGTTILELSSFLPLLQRDGAREVGGVGCGWGGDLGLAFDVLIGRGARTAAALRCLPGESWLDS